jgi:hypothetical protein
LCVVVPIARFLDNRRLSFIFVTLHFTMQIIFKLGLACLNTKGRTFVVNICCLLRHGLSHGEINNR